MGEDKLFETIKPQSLRVQVLRQLRRAILTGAMKPGDRLNETVIAREMGTSRGPVREAILALHQEGLVKIDHGRGASVAQLDPQSFRDLTEVRILLETQAVRLATERCDAASCAELAGIIEEMRDASKLHDVERVVDQDLSFHHAICRLSGNRVLLEIWEQIAGRLRLAILLSTEQGYDAGTWVETHPPVLEAMRAGDPELAAKHLIGSTRPATEEIIRSLQGVSG
jgi:DNA-binding GntR family transcriptional regulator